VDREEGARENREELAREVIRCNTFSVAEFAGKLIKSKRAFSTLTVPLETNLRKLHA